MNKVEFIDMLVADNVDNNLLYNAVIDCVWIALSDEPNTFEIKNTSISLQDLYGMIEYKAKAEYLNVIDSFEVAEMFAKHFGAKFVRPSKKKVDKKSESKPKVNLADFF